MSASEPKYTLAEARVLLCEHNDLSRVVDGAKGLLFLVCDDCGARFIRDPDQGA